MAKDENDICRGYKLNIDMDAHYTPSAQFVALVPKHLNPVNKIPAKAMNKSKFVNCKADTE